MTPRQKFDKTSTAGEPMNLKAVSWNFDGINQPNGAAHKKGKSSALTSKDFFLALCFVAYFRTWRLCGERCWDERNSWSSTDCNSWPSAQINGVLKGPQDSRQISLMNLRSWRRRQNLSILSPEQSFGHLIHLPSLLRGWLSVMLPRSFSDMINCRGESAERKLWVIVDGKRQTRMVRRRWKPWRRADWIESDFSRHQTFFFARTS